MCIVLVYLTMLTCSIGRVIWISTSRDLHTADSYFISIFCVFITTILKYIFPVGTHPLGVGLSHCIAFGCSAAGRVVCTGKLTSLTERKHTSPDKTCVSHYPAWPCLHWSPFVRCLACNKLRPKLRSALNTHNT
jgi:hypothetical protein